MRDYRIVKTVVQQRLPHLVDSLIEPCLGKSSTGLKPGSALELRIDCGTLRTDHAHCPHKQARRPIEDQNDAFRLTYRLHLHSLEEPGRKHLTKAPG